AFENDLTLIPVVNKIDLPSAQPDHVAEEIERVIGIPKREVIFASAKAGIGVREILEAIVARIPPPSGNVHRPLRALIFDSHYDSYKGVIAYVRLVDGRVTANTRLRMMASGQDVEALEVGAFRPEMTPLPQLATRDVGYV